MIIKNNNKTMSDFNITLFEACEILNRSKKSVSRYIRRGLLHPERVKSQQGTLEYRFSKADIEAFKAQEAEKAEQTGQTGQTEQVKRTEFLENKDFKGHTEQTGQNGEVITLLKETTGLLKEQLNKKDEQIKDLGGKIDGLIERDKENNYLIGQLQSKVFMLEKPKTEETGQTEQEKETTNKEEEVRKGEKMAEKDKNKKETVSNGKKMAGEDENKKREQKASFWHKIFDF